MVAALKSIGSKNAAQSQIGGFVPMKSFRYVFAGLSVLLLVLYGCSRQGKNASSAAMDQMVKDLVAAWNSHDMAKTLSFYTDDCVYEDVVLGKTFHGKEEYRALFKEVFEGVPDFKLEVKSTIASGDHLCIEWGMSGTQTGNISGVPGTGRSFSVPLVSVIDLKSGKIQRETDYYDGASLFRQLGVQPQAMAADPFVGTWKMNVAKSKTTDPSAMPKSETAKVEAVDNGLKVTIEGVGADGKAYHFEYSAKYDGKDYPITGYSAADTIAQKKIDPNSYELMAKKAGKEVERWRVAISNDGKTQTLAGKGTNAKGQEYKATFVYDKQ
jgi:steroid delta-isomerase-like uncharacterized protein